MPEKQVDFPASFDLNGADYFLLQLDKLMQAANGQHNVCSFAICLAEPLSLNRLEAQLASSTAYRWLCQLRLHPGLPFALHRWQQDSRARLPVIHEYRLAKGTDLTAQGFSRTLDIRRQSPLMLDLYQTDGAGSILVFTWHHALMDARGGEIFICALGDSQQSKAPQWLSKPSPELALKDRANIASAMKQFLYDTAQLPLLSLHKAASKAPQNHYHAEHFSAAENSLIRQRAAQLAPGFNSAFYLAATAYATTQVLQQRGETHGDMLIPVPLDRRKRGANGPVVGNQVSFLFYRLPNALLSDVAACSQEIIRQMQALMRAESPQHYSIMLDFLRRLPGIFYRRLLKAPTQGLMASFSYSDTGDSLQDFSTWGGLKVSEARHYPPNLYPPGLTVVFSRFQGLLQMTLSYMTPDLQPEELAQLLSHLRQALLGEASA